jgi:hypothetical protein
VGNKESSRSSNVVIFQPDIAFIVISVDDLAGAESANGLRAARTCVGDVDR